MKRTFLILSVIALAIVVFIALKYWLLKEEPQFSEMVKAPEDETLAASLQAPNRALAMVFVQGDSTIIGHLGYEADDDEFPPRDVYVPSFYITPHEITREQWSMANADYKYDPEEKDLPIVRVSFFDVLEYCNQKSILDGYKPCYDFMLNGVTCDFNATGYRLPTEAEWEFAAKGRKRDNFTRYSGSNSADNAGWHKGNSEGSLHPVGQKQKNDLGLYDMSGNAFEWVWNWYSRYHYSQQALFEGPSDGTDKVIRGGSWFHDASEMRVTNRNYAKPHTQSNYIGFRLVRRR